MKKFGTLVVATTLLALGACKNSGSKERFLPPSTGGINSLMVVMDTELWRGPGRGEDQGRVCGADRWSAPNRA